MARELNKLSTKKIPGPPEGKHADGGGLWLHIRPDGGGQWFLRVTIFGRRREMGLGKAKIKDSDGYTVSLAEARKATEKWRAVARDDKDPIKEREKMRKEAARSRYTLEVVAEHAFKARQAELKNDGCPSEDVAIHRVLFWLLLHSM